MMASNILKTIYRYVLNIALKRVLRKIKLINKMRKIAKMNSIIYLQMSKYVPN